ncbi:hypothetical protein NBZ79_16100 [Sneathiella marina]|uniref:Uncharacterized protein n=1 Tax=Sneathiella marina TaxID=2950108 RepID=A0ABY4W1F8_9PROT|nr:hypothetical protein [Sneathiella marina]USG60689.1 hypothetical protein NBZ79_16100 [Sneathiella marina]
MNGTFSDFLSSLLAFESGWDRERFDSGNIQSFQLDQWAGGTVDSFFPNYDSWSDLTNDEWTMMAYRSTNSLGFVGFQFGEALLIDLGYYDDDFFYGSGASSNTWDGVWTGKNGANSLEDFMTQDVQDIAIQDAFGHNLGIIQEGLAAQGQTLEQFIGQTGSYIQNGQEVSVELSMTGILAAAHLRGAYGLLDLLQGGAVSSDEYGTSILQYIEQFGGYESPSVSELIANFEAGKTGDEGLGVPDGSTGSPGGPSNGDANTSAEDADISIDWAYGTHSVFENFNPATDTIFVAWFTAAHIEIAEANGNVVISIPSNNQTVTLANIAIADLGASNFTFLDPTAAEKILASVGNGSDEATNPDETEEPDTPEDSNEHEHPMPDTAVMHQITLTSPSRTIDDFDPARDMFHIEAGITDELLEIKEVSTANGSNVVLTVYGPNNIVSSVTVAENISIADLSLANFAISDSSALNEVATVLGQAVSTPIDGEAFDITYDSDGSNPASHTGDTESGGIRYKADFNADDILNFDVEIDQVDFRDISVHGMITNKSPSGELIIDNPWGPDMQILQGVQFSDLTTENFGIVGNEHLRQDIGGVLSWELGVGPRNSDTVYIRSHEYGVHEQVDGFDPSTMKISFLYFGTRERLSVEDTDDGMVISTLPSGQSMTFTGVELADLQPGTLEFHHDQVMEDRLEEPFGFSQNDVALVSRELLLTPEAPEGASTDGFQVREGVLTTENEDNGSPDPEDTNTDPDPDPVPNPDPGASDGDGNSAEPGNGGEIHHLTWKWSAIDVLADFDASEDTLDFGSLSANDVSISQADNDLLIEIVNNGGHTYVLENTQVDDLSADNFTAGNWNGVLEDEDGVYAQLIGLGASQDGFS